MADALLVVDVQNDFFEGGLLEVPGAELALPFINMEIEDELVRSPDSLVIFSLDYHPPTTPHFVEWPPHCVAGTTGAQLHPELFVPDNAVYVFKGQADDDGYSAFSKPASVESRFETLAGDLDEFLKSYEVTHLRIIGIATDFCVKQTALEARRLGYDVTIQLAACAAVYPENLKAPLQELHDAGCRLYLHFIELDQEALDMYL